MSDGRMFEDLSVEEKLDTIAECIREINKNTLKLNSDVKEVLKNQRIAKAHAEGRVWEK